MGNIINRRRVCGSKSLPYDAEIEYLESSGTQWIDTGISPYGRTPKVMIDFKLKSTGGGVFGTWGANNTRFQIFVSPAMVSGSIGIGSFVNITWQKNTRYLLDMDATTMTATINDVKYTGFSAPNGFANYNLYLFWRNNNNGDGTQPIPMFCYSCKVYDGNTLVRDLIPVRVDNVGYMYDKVSGQLFGNSGTGNFILGQDKTN